MITYKVREAKRRAKYLNYRDDMLQQWTDLVGSDTSKVVLIRKGIS